MGNRVEIASDDTGHLQALFIEVHHKNSKNGIHGSRHVVTDRLANRLVCFYATHVRPVMLQQHAHFYPLEEPQTAFFMAGRGGPINRQSFSTKVFLPLMKKYGAPHIADAHKMRNIMAEYSRYVKVNKFPVVHCQHVHG